MLSIFMVISSDTSSSFSFTFTTSVSFSKLTKTTYDSSLAKVLELIVLLMWPLHRARASCYLQCGWLLVVKPFINAYADGLNWRQDTLQNLPTVEMQKNTTVDIADSEILTRQEGEKWHSGTQSLVKKTTELRIWVLLHVRWSVNRRTSWREQNWG